MKTFCPSCEKETNCVYIAELYECKECGCDFESKQRQMQERLDAATARAEKAEADSKRLRDALERFGQLDLTSPIGDAIAWDILNARAVLKGGEE